MERAGKQRTIASLLVRNDRQSFEVAPQKVIYANWEEQPISEVVIKTVYPQLDDVYIVMAAFGQDGAASFHIFVNPLVAFLWLGGALLVIGGLISWWPEAAPVTVDARTGRWRRARSRRREQPGCSTLAHVESERAGPGLQ